MNNMMGIIKGTPIALGQQQTVEERLQEQIDRCRKQLHGVQEQIKEHEAIMEAGGRDGYHWSNFTSPTIIEQLKQRESNFEKRCDDLEAQLEKQQEMVAALPVGPVPRPQTAPLPPGATVKPTPAMFPIPPLRRAAQTGLVEGKILVSDVGPMSFAKAFSTARTFVPEVLPTATKAAKKLLPRHFQALVKRFWGMNGPGYRQIPRGAGIQGSKGESNMIASRNGHGFVQGGRGLAAPRRARFRPGHALQSRNRTLGQAQEGLHNPLINVLANGGASVVAFAATTKTDGAINVLAWVVGVVTGLRAVSALTTFK